jgi:hypothetical protein
MTENKLPGFKIVPGYRVHRADYPPEGLYRRFPGIKPRGVCDGFNKDTCKGKQGTDLDCAWIKNYLGQEYCKSPIASVSKKVPPGYSAFLESQPGQSHCLRLPRKKCETTSDCQWIKESGKSNRSYCRGSSYTTKPLSTMVPRIPMYGKAFTATGRYSPRRYSSEEKETWYNPLGLKLLPERKYCHCLLESAAEDLFRNGHFTRSPYAVCNSTISSKYAASLHKSIHQLGSDLAKMGIHQGCTIYANFDTWPTELLYTYAKMHESSSSGRQFFSNLPSVKEFLGNQENYRRRLLSLINAYKSKALKK